MAQSLIESAAVFCLRERSRASFRGTIFGAMKNEMLQVLTRFHREVFLPDFQRIVLMRRLRNCQTR